MPRTSFSAISMLVLGLLILSSLSQISAVGLVSSSSETNALPTYIYVANSGDNTVSVINGKTNTVVTTIKVGYDPGSIAFDPTTGWIYVANAGHPYSGDGNISVISPFTNKVIKTFDDPGPGMIVDVKGKLWVTNAYQEVGFIRILSPRNGSVLRRIDPCNCSEITEEAYSPANNEVYAVPIANGNVSIIDASSLAVIGHLKLQGSFTGRIAYDPLNKDTYFSYYKDKVLVVNQENNVINSIKVGYNPDSITYNAANHDIYVANLGSNTTSIIDSRTNRVVATVKNVGSSALGMSFDRFNGDVYLTDWSRNIVTVLRGKTIIDRINVGNTPTSVAVS